MDTPITALRMGLSQRSEMPTVVQQVLSACEAVRDLTEGVFDPWKVPGGVDPSGYVKGWAADVAADMIVSQGYLNVSVNAAGDVTCRGFQSPEQPWVIGIRHPVDPMAVVAATEVLDGAIATSGEYERGRHIINPRAMRREVKLSSATVVGPDGGVADALATALLIEGTDGVRWFGQLPGWSGYLIEGETAHFFGPAFDPALRGQPGQPEDTA
jgi:thiamine biosynthesis lipoprotein